MVTDTNVGTRQKGNYIRISVPLPLARNSVIMIMIYVACYDVCYIFLYMEDIMVYVLHISIWKTLWYMYNAAAGAFMRYGAGGRLGRRCCSRSMNRVAPPGGDGGLEPLLEPLLLGLSNISAHTLLKLGRRFSKKLCRINVRRRFVVRVLMDTGIMIRTSIGW